jgi:hypothetical protein
VRLNVLFIANDIEDADFKGRREEHCHLIDGEGQRLNLPDGRDERNVRKNAIRAA